KGVSNLSLFVARIDQLRFETQNLALREVVEHVISGSGLAAHYQNDKDGSERVENLHELVNAAAAFSAEAAMPVDDDGVSDGMSALAAFLSHAALEAGDNQASEGQDAVQLMTIHAAKGLE